MLFFGLTGCAKTQNEELEDSIKQTKEDNKELENTIDYSTYTNIYLSKIISAQLYYYAIEDINNDGIPELIAKNGNKITPNFKIYKLEKEELIEVTDNENRLNISGIYEITKNNYSNGKVVYIVSGFGDEYTMGGNYIDLAYFGDGIYTEYSKLIGMDLDTLSESKIYKKTLNFETSKITENEFQYVIDGNSSSIENAVKSSEYTEE